MTRGQSVRREPRIEGISSQLLLAQPGPDPCVGACMQFTGYDAGARRHDLRRDPHARPGQVSVRRRCLFSRSSRSQFNIEFAKFSLESRSKVTGIACRASLKPLQVCACTLCCVYFVLAPHPASPSLAHNICTLRVYTFLYVHALVVRGSISLFIVSLP